MHGPSFRLDLASIEAPGEDPGWLIFQAIPHFAQSPLARRAARSAEMRGRLSPATHHLRPRQLVTRLGQVPGAERVRYVHVDRVVLDGLEHGDP